MSSGSSNYGSSATALQAISSWSGANDPLRKSENSYTMTKCREARSLSQRWANGAPYGNPGYEYVTRNWYPPMSTFTANDELALLSRLADMIRDDSPDLATNLGELPETLRSISNLCKSAFSGWRSFKKGRFGDALRHWSRFGSGGGSSRLRVSDVADATLALRYGWQPLASDISKACAWLEKRTQDPRTLKYRVSRTVHVSGVNTSTSSIPIPGNGAVIVGYRLTMVERVSVPRALGLLNPANVAWELMPFSFIVDWFVPIGSYLDTLGFFWGLGYTCVRFELQKGEVSFYPGLRTLPPPYQMIQIVGGGVTNRSATFRRVPGYKIKVPLPSMKSVRRAFSLQHVENAAALVWSGISSLRAI